MRGSDQWRRCADEGDEDVVEAEVKSSGGRAVGGEMIADRSSDSADTTRHLTL